MIAILKPMEMNTCTDSPLSPRERVGVRVSLAAKAQWKRLRRFPRYCSA